MYDTGSRIDWKRINSSSAKRTRNDNLQIPICGSGGNKAAGGKYRLWFSKERVGKWTTKERKAGKKEAKRKVAEKVQRKISHQWKQRQIGYQTALPRSQVQVEEWAQGTAEQETWDPEKTLDVEETEDGLESWLDDID